MDIVIVGGGIGGLTLAHLLALKGQNIRVRVYERDADKLCRNQGYSIGIDDASIEILSSIQGNEELDNLLQTNRKNPCSGIVMTNDALTPLLTFSSPIMLISRWGLRNALANHVDIIWNKKYISHSREEDGKVKINFADGTKTFCDLLVGADGANSQVRKIICPNVKREDLNLRNISGSLEFPEEDLFVSEFPKLRKIVDKGLIRCLGLNGFSMLLFAYESESGKRILWSVSWHSSAETLEESLGIPLLEAMKINFKCEELMRVVSLTKENDFLQFGKILSAKPRKSNPYLRCNSLVTLLGDAAHPMTTHRGAGANTAIKDAEDLSDTILAMVGKEEDEIQKLLVEYEEKLFRIGFKAVAESYQSTSMIHMKGFSASIRNCVLWFVGWGVYFYQTLSRK